MSKKEITIEIFEPEKTPVRSMNCKTFNTSLASKDYIGLNNQGIPNIFNEGNTCYLNALLQALFMTPDFRLKIFNWGFNETEQGKSCDSIPFQIKKLFARLQMKSRTSEETKDLTKSIKLNRKYKGFQWDKKEVHVQHDIQELCRVLFEAIEFSLSKEKENFINDLFEGESIHIVKCLTCNTESVRSDKFLDISLPIRNDFLKIRNKSLEMAFVNYLKPELLGNGNEYKCGNCDKKVKKLISKFKG
jgi:ubiquitin C-terminal hydrolase